MSTTLQLCAHYLFTFIFLHCNVSQLQPEFLLEIFFSIATEKDLASFVQVKRAVYQTQISQLYRRNVKHSNRSAIRHAADPDNYPAILRALQSWRDINSSAEPPKSPNIIKSTPFFDAAYENNTLAAGKILLDYRANLNDRDKSKYTPLYVAREREQIAVVKTLLAQPKIKVNIYNTHHMALIY